MADVYMNSKFLLKRGTAEKWAELNPILERGEPGFIIDEQRLKIGDGVTHFNDLPYIGENDIINKNSHYDFPSIGRADAIYKAETEALLYQWNSTKLAYEPLNQGEGQMVQYDTIWGGNASGLTSV